MNVLIRTRVYIDESNTFTMVPSICVFVHLFIYIIRPYVSLEDSSKFYVFLQVAYDRLLQRDQNLITLNLIINQNIYR